MLRESLTEERQPPQVIVHEGDGRAVDGDLAARRAHRDADVTRRERRGVVHPVADHGHAIAFEFRRANKFHFLVLAAGNRPPLLRSQFPAPPATPPAGGRRKSLRCGRTPPGLKFRKRLFRFARVSGHLQADPADAFKPPYAHKEQTEAFGAVEVHGFR